MRKLLLIASVFCSFIATSQELNCDVIVNARQTGNENVQVFKTLETQLKEFVNNTKWTNKDFSQKERINCSMVINITGYNNDVFQGSIQILSSRPVFNSSYSTPIYNFNDKDFSFRYQEFQNINYNPNQFQSNLVSVLAFHINVILGMDADSFALNGGDQYYQQARTILSYSQQSNFKGWKPEDGLQSRFVLIDNLLSPTYKEFRSTLYNYHIGGLDTMHLNQKNAKQKISDALHNLEAINRRRPSSFIMRVFFDAKANEIEEIFTDGPSISITDLVASLTKMAPNHSNKWRNISY
ncbi:type IX secretion system protein PorD [Pontimicrobium aquaticum]|uniref:DUF4835 family protein n=1 Tax=Pontimicrobium aquaticum TaxID=2565367 RepID=A0A4V5LQQ7_9FLAO|nr:DUF4835 family protein [Pontimicrobium aquaticum]TJY36079.1 DUF4835 family protein [Pontimicrobium aquaticum]